MGKIKETILPTDLHDVLLVIELIAALCAGGQMACKEWILVTVMVLHCFAFLVVATPQGNKNKNSTTL